MPDSRNFPRQQPGGADWFMQAPLLTWLLCAASVVTTGLFWLAQQPGHTIAYSSLGPVAAPDIWGGQYWGLVTGVFLHGGLLHLLFNMIWLYQLGGMLERSLNTLTYLVFVVAAAAIGSGCELAFDGTTGIGMSGVVYAIFGLMWAGRGRYPQWGAYATNDNLRLFLGWGIFCFVATYFGWMSIANWAHAGGLLFGLSVGWLFLSARPHRWLWAIPLAGLIALTVLSVTWMPWSPSWKLWKSARQSVSLTVPGADNTMP
ncbi:MAG: rhomboid family intramembrane serine protease [Armatimonadetes bacterium]|nr:rhomboid family intramembrane serine protease [Armatimonadota bacterium]